MNTDVQVTAPAQQEDEDLRKLNIAELRECFAEIVNLAASGQRAVVMRRGREIAAIVPIADLDTLRAIPVPVQELTYVVQTPAVFSMTTAIPSTDRVSEVESG